MLKVLKDWEEEQRCVQVGKRGVRINFSFSRFMHVILPTVIFTISTNHRDSK